jgi:hypothetical protein
MFVVFWTEKIDGGALGDRYEAHDSEESAARRCDMLAAWEHVYAWGMAPISRASEPHWTVGAEHE